MSTLVNDESIDSYALSEILLRLAIRSQQIERISFLKKSIEAANKIQDKSIKILFIIKLKRITFIFDEQNLQLDKEIQGIEYEIDKMFINSTYSKLINTFVKKLYSDFQVDFQDKSKTPTINFLRIIFQLKDVKNSIGLDNTIAFL